LHTVDLAKRAHDKVKGYSHGMKQRLGIAGALLRDPKLLLLDEPTTGLDPAGMRDMRALVHRLAEDGLTVLLSSHLMDEVEDLCDRVAIVTRGQVVYEGALDELIASTAGRYDLRTTDDEAAAAIAYRWFGITNVATTSRGIEFAGDERAVAALTLELAQKGIGLLALVPRTATLEELFFRMTEGTPEPALEAVA
jgi:ABC-2 type transport system ATP-binding protein